MFQATRLLAALILSTLATSAFAADKLVILSPHRKTIQEEFVPLFKSYYEKTYGSTVEVDWIDQGGTSNAVKYLAAKAEKNPKDIGIDVFWGGTSANFIDMARQGLLAPYKLSDATRKAIPEKCAGVALSDPKNLWHATEVSSFGILFNRTLLKMEKLPEPKTWSDLGHAQYFNLLSSTDPRKSGTSSTMNTIILEAEGWAKGWELLTRMAGNTRVFTQSSSDPVRAVGTGDAGAATVVDFYGLSQVLENGPDKVSFLLPAGKTIIDPDPIALVKNAPHEVVAGRFVEFLLTKEAQKVWILPKGEKDGPTRAVQARLAVHPLAYKETEGRWLPLLENPYLAKGYLQFDAVKAGEWREPLNDLVGAILVDSHADLKRAWKRILDDKQPANAVAAFVKPIVSEKDLKDAAAKWNDDVYRNTKINEWVQAAKSKYTTLAAGQIPKA